MVDYSCSICKKNYGSSKEALKKAEECENQGFIGPEIKPGLLFSHKEFDQKFLIIYGQSGTKGHERLYFAENFLVWRHLIYAHKEYTFLGSEINQSLEEFVLSNDKNVKELHKKIRRGIKGSDSIKNSLEEYGARELHNECDFFKK